MHIHSRVVVWIGAALAVSALAGCPGAKLPGGGGVPGGVPGGLGGASGEVDPNTCVNYAGSDAGRKLKAFLQATKDLEATTAETARIVKQSCITIGNEIGMTEADYRGDTDAICAAVYGRVKDNLKVSLKPSATLKVKYTPAVCRVDIQAQAKAAAECEGKVTADVGASCTGACHGKCNGTCAGKAGTGGSGGECHGECKGTCEGSCEGHADVNASAQCKASASVKASVELECTKPELTIEADAKLVVDKDKAEMTIRGLRAGLPEVLSVKARLKPLQHAVVAWIGSAKELKDMGPKFIQSFGDQAMCISGQIAAAAQMIGRIEANVSVSVSVSASASGSIGG